MVTQGRTLCKTFPPKSRIGLHRDRGDDPERHRRVSKLVMIFFSFAAGAQLKKLKMAKRNRELRKPQKEKKKELRTLEPEARSFGHHQFNENQVVLD